MNGLGEHVEFAAVAGKWNSQGAPSWAAEHAGPKDGCRNRDHGSPKLLAMGHHLRLLGLCVVIGQTQAAHGLFATVVDAVDERVFELEEVGHGAGKFFEGAHAVAVGDAAVGVAEVALLELRTVHGREERGHGVADVVEAELFGVRPRELALPAGDQVVDAPFGKRPAAA